MATKYLKMIPDVILLINKGNMVMLSKKVIPFTMRWKLFQCTQVAKAKWKHISKETRFIPMVRKTIILPGRSESSVR